MPLFNTLLRVVIEGDTSSIRREIDRLGPSAQKGFRSVTDAAKVELAKVTKDAEKAAKEVASLDKKFAQQSKPGGSSGLADAYKLQGQQARAELTRLEAKVAEASGKLRTELAKGGTAFQPIEAGARETAASLGALEGELGPVAGELSAIAGVGGAAGGEIAGGFGGAVGPVTALNAELATTEGELAAVGSTAAVTGAELAGVGAAGTEGAAATGLFGKASQGASNALGQLGISGGVAKAAIGGVAAGAAVLVGTKLEKFTADGVKGFVDLTGQARTYQRTTKLSAEDSSKLASAMRAMGIDADTGAGAFFKFSRNLEKNADALQKQGVAIAHNADGSTNLLNTFLNVSDAIHNTTDATKANEIAFLAMGKGATSVNKLMVRGKDSIKDLFAEGAKHHEIFTQDQLNQGAEFNKSMRNLDEATKDFQRSLGEGLVPTLASLATVAGNVLGPMSQLERHFHAFSGGITGAVAGLIPGGSLLKAWGEHGKKAGDETKDAGVSAAEMSAAIADAGDSASGAEPGMDEFASLTEKIKTEAEQADARVSGLNSEFERLTSGAISLDAAESGVHEAMSKLVDTFTGGADHAGKLAEAQQAVADAQRDLSTTTKDSTSTALDRTVASEKLAQAQRELAAVQGAAGASLDSNTEKGRENLAAVRDGASAVLDHINALKSQHASIDDVSAAWDRDVGSLQETLRNAHLTDDQINLLLTHYGLIPANKATLVTAYTEEAEKHLTEVLRLYQAIASQKGANAQPGDFAGAAGAPIPRGREHGGPVSSGIPYVVTEKGDELYVPAMTPAAPGAVSTLAHPKAPRPDSALDVAKPTKGNQTHQRAAARVSAIAQLLAPVGLTPSRTASVAAPIAGAVARARARDEKPAERASGGPVAGPRPKGGIGAVLLGKRGPQLFVPPARGVVVNAQDTRKLLTHAGDPALTARVLAKAGADSGTIKVLRDRARSIAAPEGRERGGPVMPNKPYSTAERGEELYFPSTSTQQTGGHVSIADRKSISFNFGDTVFRVEAGVSGGAGSGLNRSSAEKIVGKHQRALMEELKREVRRQMDRRDNAAARHLESRG